MPLPKLLAPPAVIVILLAGTWFWGGVVAPGYNSAIGLVVAWFVLCSVIFGRIAKARPELRWWFRGTFLACSAACLAAFWFTSLRDTEVNEALPDAVAASQIAGADPGTADPLSPQPVGRDRGAQTQAARAGNPTKPRADAGVRSDTKRGADARPRARVKPRAAAAKPKGALARTKAPAARREGTAAVKPKPRGAKRKAPASRPKSPAVAPQPAAAQPEPAPAAQPEAPRAQPEPAGAPPQTPATSQAPAVNVIERSGAVRPASHSASGTARVVKLATGGRVLTLSDGFEIDPGPQVRVYLATDASGATFNDLGALKGNKGDQQYDIPAGVDLDTYDTLVFWCVPFTVTLATADLRPA